MAHGLKTLYQAQHHSQAKPLHEHGYFGHSTFSILQSTHLKNIEIHVQNFRKPHPYFQCPWSTGNAIILQKPWDYWDFLPIDIVQSPITSSHKPWVIKATPLTAINTWQCLTIHTSSNLFFSVNTNFSIHQKKKNLSERDSKNSQFRRKIGLSNGEFPTSMHPFACVGPLCFNFPARRCWGRKGIEERRCWWWKSHGYVLFSVWEGEVCHGLLDRTANLWA